MKTDKPSLMNTAHIAYVYIQLVFEISQ